MKKMAHIEVDQMNLVQTLFTEAIDVPDEQLESFLQQRCGDDLELQQRVRSLVERDREVNTSKFVETSVPEAAQSTFVESSIGKRIGAYKIVECIGAGGMGDVFRGLRDDEFQQQVAIKLIRPSMQTTSLAKRFRNEMHCLASLGKHANITGILDAGETETGQLYLVMEYVDGIRIDQYCDQQSLSIRSRLELFCKVCETVQFAHQSLVLHRDLKPGNLLITSDGQPKLIDFGVSKLFANEVDFSTHQTQTTHPTFTPGYSSPEQLNGQPTATTSDVYSLGVILYELLTGHLPHRVAGESLVDLLNTVSNVDPTRPSEVVKQSAARQNEDESVAHADSQTIASQRATTPKKLQATIRGDLDRIVLKAIEKEPSRRYQTAQQFGEDIQRYLNGQPVLARGDSIGYRLKKGFQRNKAAVATVASILLLLICGIVVSARFAVLANRSAERATEAAESERQQRLLTEKREKTANQIAELFESMVERANPARFGGKKFLVRDLLEDLANRVRSDEIAEPLVRARLLRSLAASYRGLGEFGLCHRYLKSAIGILETELGASHFQTLETRLQRAESRIRYGSPEAAKLELQEVLATMSASGSNDPKLDNLRFKATLLLGNALTGTDELEAAEKTLDDAAQLASNSSERLSVKRTQHRLDIKQGKFEKALTFAISELSRTREAYGNDDHRTAIKSQYVGGILNYLKRYQEAEEFLRESLDTTRKLHGNDHVETLRAVMNLAITNFNQQDFEASEALFREYEEIALRIKHYQGPHHHRMLVKWAQCLHEVGKLEEAKSVLDRCQNFIAKYPSTHQSKLSKLKIEVEKLAEAMKLENSN